MSWEMGVEEESEVREDVVRAIQAALEEQAVPAVLFADIVEHSEFDFKRVDEQLEKLRRIDDGPVESGRSGGVTLYWINDASERDFGDEGADTSTEELAKRIESLERRLEETD